ncbi:hypothetical protein B9T36_09675 [Acinetobacter sp. ANC 4204]|uniref:DUF2971 domain-containing protein n=1 Tax=Acinetobacter sp. ANC 4204 TaxID=1977884 RepID=UPI000A34D792|nr:DUF2971 domain-containing protein [Acinetobacter sp. ANC 4204]OTG58615.1 hypothetical protein B9T36_09675 [Acinetobacter sp. ANC 4204]
MQEIWCTLFKFLEWGNELSFFKFVSEERIDIIRKGCIRFTPASDFNDPFEFKPHLTKINRKFLPYHLDSLTLSEHELIAKYENATVSEELSEREISEYSAERNFKYTKYKNELNKILSDYGVLSLFHNGAETYNPSIIIHDENEPRQNILMWSYYANNHKGMVIEFHNSFFFNETRQVTYDNDRPLVTYEDIDDRNEENLFQIFNTKKNVWHNESEFRVVKRLEDADRVIGDNLDIHLFNFNKKYIKSVTMGCKADPKFCDEVYQLLKDDPELNHVAFFTSQIHEEKFCLKFFQKSQMYGRTFTNAPIFEDMDVTSKIPQQLPPDSFDF